MTPCSSCSNDACSHLNRGNNEFRPFRRAASHPGHRPAIRRGGYCTDTRARGGEARIPHRSRRQDGRARLLLLRFAGGTGRQRHGLHGVGADGRTDRQDLGVLAPALTVTKFGTDAQKKKYVHGWVAGTQLGFFAMTESNTGSDVASMKTYAVDKGDHWEVHGSKMWISQAHFGDAGLLYAYTDRTKGNKGMTAFIIEPKNMKGCTARPIETKLGLKCAPTGEFAFDGMKVPKENVLGKPGEG